MNEIKRYEITMWENDADVVPHDNDDYVLLVVGLQIGNTK